MALAMLSLVASANETITIYYAFSPGDTTAAYGRSLVEEANRIQNRYTFLFDTKPGAGNAIAANHVRNTANAVLMTSSAFFIRPNFYPNESYDIADFRELMPQCEAAIAISSVQYKSWDQVPKDKQLNIGVSGLGVTTHLTALQVIAKYPNIQAIPFKGTNDSVLSLVSGNTEFHVGYLGESEAWNQVHIIGITGNRPINQHPTLVSEGFPLILREMSAPQHLVVPKSMTESKFDDLRTILVRAARADSVRATYAVDHCQAMSDMPTSELDKWYANQTEKWRKLASGVRIN